MGYIAQATDYYWVENSGNWSDINHWATSSGGMTKHSVVPTPLDGVFFNANSGNSVRVTIDVEQVYCRNMNWTGALGSPTLLGTAEKEIHVFGALTFVPQLKQVFKGDFFFEGDHVNNLITSAGCSFNQHIYVNGSGNWVLADALSVFNSFYLIQGDFSTANQRVFTRNFLSREGKQRHLALGKTYWTLRTSDPQDQAKLEWAMNPINLVLDAAHSTIDFSNFSGSIMGGPQGPALQYNVVLFSGGDAQLNTQLGQQQCFDTIHCAGSLYNYGSNTTQVLRMFNVNQVFQINPQDTFTLTQWIVPDLCEGMIELSSTVVNEQAYLNTTQALTVQRMLIRDIKRIGPGATTANHSIDLGNNQGWVINKSGGHDLYWVGKGGSGSWYERANWAATSGGAGGACIPTALDNVFFDANSFDGPNQSVISRDQYAYCKNMTWTGVSHNPINFGMWVLNAYGSVDLPENKVGGISELRLLSPDQNQTLLTRGHHIYNAFLNGTGSWILQDTLSATNLYQRSGEFNSNGKPVTTETFFMLNDDFTSLKMGNSHWRITRNGSLSSSLYSFFIGPKATVDAGTSLLEFTNTMPTYISYADVKFYHVLFSNPEGTASLLSDYEAAGDKIPKVSTFNRIEMRNSGIMLGENVMDSLIFTAGKSYDLDGTHAQTIHKYFQLVGNPCDSIELRSTVLGRKAIVQMNGGVVRADFIQMRDQSGVGSTQFFAGSHSTNLNNSNENWGFASSIEGIEAGFLGEDVVLCKQNSITLDAHTFNFNETYLWGDGSTQATLLVSQAGTYHVAVTYRVGCVLSDTVRVLSLSEFKLRLVHDTTLCAKQDLVLNADLKLTGATYHWQDGSNHAQIRVAQAGKYKVVVGLSGCSVTDSTTVRIISAAILNLGRDTSLSGTESLLLDASKTGSRNYLWSDHSSAPTLSVRSAGTFWVEVNDGGCSARDTIVVKAAYLDFPIFFKAFTPNAFSPNGNKANEVFRPYINELVQVKSYELQVYDRWGGQVFRSSDLHIGWDGSIRGQTAPSGVYRYWFRIEYIDDKGPGNARVQGEVSLIR